MGNSVWKEITLGDYIEEIAAGPFGSNLKISCFVKSGFPVVDGANLKGIRLTDNITKFVTKEKAYSLRRSIAKKGDLVATISGTIGQISIVPENSRFEEYLCSQRQFKVRFKKELVDPNFMVYYFHTYEGKNKILSFGNQVGVPALSQPIKNFKLIKMFLPDIKTQKKIATILQNIDDKIENNNEINDNLYKQIQTTIKNYLPYSQDDQISGWEKVNLSAIASFIGGYSYKSSELVKDAETAMATIKNFERNGGFKLDGFKEIEPSAKLKSQQSVELFDALVAHTDLTQNAEVIGNAEILLTKSNYEKIIFSMDLVKVLPKSDFSKFLLGGILQDKRFKEHCLRYVNGSTVLHLSKNALPSYELLLPINRNVLIPLAELLKSLYLNLAANIDENIRLSKLRDTLLPKLMSGEIDVDSIEL